MRLIERQDVRAEHEISSRGLACGYFLSLFE
jgi:hypothetical protein